MRYSQLFGKSIRSVSHEVKSKGHEFLLRGGFIRESSAGRFYLLPLGIRVQEKICSIIESEMNSLGAQKMLAPILHPYELWEETNRTKSVSFELMQVADRSERKFVLGGTAEEMLVSLVRQFSISLKDLPFCLYQFSTKFRDELRVRGGMLRAREFLMKDGYSFHPSKENFDVFYQKIIETYKRIFHKLHLPVQVVASDNGYMGGDYCHEFIVDHPLGESQYLATEDGAYFAHEDIATFERQLMNQNEALLPLTVIDAKRGTTIQAGVDYYGLPSWRQIKTILYILDSKEPILVSVRGDLEISEAKLIRLVRAGSLRLATQDEVHALGSVIGFVSPLKLAVKKIGDISLTTVKNFYTGADEWERDTINVNYGRDFVVDMLGDIAVANEGHSDAHNGSILHKRKGIEVGNVFQLGTWYSDRMEGASFTSSDGQKHPYYMGCYGIGIGRTMASIAEMYHDDLGLRWPLEVSPYDIHLLGIGKDKKTHTLAEEVYSLLQRYCSVLYDDREVSAGVKFSDADLIGIPKRLVVSDKLSGNQTGELSFRGSERREFVAVSDLCKVLFDAGD